MEDVQQALKRACALVRSGATVGTGYLVASDLVATCEHVVPGAREGDAVTLTFGYPLPEVARTARVARTDPAEDCAVLRLDEPMTDRVPLQLSAAPLPPRSAWFTFGYPAVTKADGTHFAGVVDDAKGVKSGRYVIVLTSEKIAAGMSTPIHGLSGSPVVIGQAVAGHIASVRPDPDFPQRAAFGEVFACPAAGVIRLLDAIGRPVPLAAAAVPPPHATPPALGHRAYHAFVSYRSTDRGFALDLVERLEARGFSIYIDQREVLPGDELAVSLQNAIAASAAAIILVSRKWVESPWCQQEMTVLLHRAVDSRTPVIPVRLDDVELPPMLASKVWLDCAGASIAPAEQLERIVAAIGENPVRAAVPRPPVAPSGPTTPWSRIEASARDPEESTLTAAQALISIGEPRAAVEMLKGAGQGTRARQLRALALSKSGWNEAAITELEPLVSSGQLDAETGGILGGRYKDLWIERGDAKYLHKAYRIYRTAYERSGDTYPGINVLAMGLYLRKHAPHLLGAKDGAQLAAVATAVRAKTEPITEETDDHWQLATRAEVLLLGGDLDGARRFYALAASANPLATQDIARMRNQARRNLRYLGLPEDGVDASLQVPCVAAFTGHMTDLPGRPTPRLPEAKVGALRARIRALLDQHRIGFGFSSAARGSDILFAEEVLARGGRVRLFLPFAPTLFRITSVETPADPRWIARFDDLLTRAASTDPRVNVSVLANMPPPEAEHPRAYAACNLAVQNAAVEKAQLLDSKPSLIAVWDGNPDGGAGGAADAIRDWCDRGAGDVEIIDTATL
ncbi:TIR domain-containing protein [Anaeromyxobacter sp. Fw109-5]|uniref:TIR domain-containing protein n=1 Tax=Anaeromyxobacter sp. (strain Fw109-5) TaxID=404589 RepID=UPI0000ED6CFC|nr:TIR domain-containing protein [Anaeromyxobacter sp. Fw109-5]ABS28177.1 TIR protein [Anaeromyxobacter sp. Fw109-5]